MGERDMLRMDEPPNYDELYGETLELFCNFDF